MKHTQTMHSITDKLTLLVGDQHERASKTPYGLLLKSNRLCNIAAALTYGFYDVPGTAYGKGVPVGSPVFLYDVSTRKTYLAGQLLGVSSCPNDADWALNKEGKANTFTYRIYFTGVKPLTEVGEVGIVIKFNKDHPGTVNVNKLHLEV